MHTPKGIVPHVYETATLSYKGMALWNHPQSILVSGESGAGKTETVKICMDQIAALQKGPGHHYQHDQTEVAQRVLDSNPLLEAFGNAKTRRNDNSSRFGKYIKLQFDRKSDCGSPALLAGSTCEVYLLEKNRVVSHDKEGERNYHIFYELLAAPEDSKIQIWDGLKGASPRRFKYVGESTSKSIEGVTDHDRFLKTMHTLEGVGIEEEERMDIFRALCVVMQLGNMTFAPDKKEEEKSVISSIRELRPLASLMGLDEEELRIALTERTVAAAGEKYKVPLTAEAAKESCDGLAKDIYEKVFLWLVRNINAHTTAENNYYNEHNPQMLFGTIGLLDIFGFECFAVNRFEQLCINYANEKLQSKFTKDCFKLIELEYKNEGIALDNIEYVDNADVLELIEGKKGLLDMLNEECWRPQGNAAAFVNKALHQNKSSSRLIVNNIDRLSFGVHHYAGKVLYNTGDFVTRNQDRLPADLKGYASRVSNSIIANEYKMVLEEAQAQPQGRGRSSNSSLMAKTVWTKYKSQLSQLMNDLQQTESRYIRCIKPNTLKRPLLVEHNLTIGQLQSCGVVASVTIARSAFPNRMDHAAIVSRFGGIWRRKNKEASTIRKTMSSDEKVKARVEAILSHALRRKTFTDPVSGKTKHGFIVGKTKTYFRAGALEYLEAERINGLSHQATVIQRTYRAFVKRRWENEEKHALHHKQEEAKRMWERKRARIAKEERERKEAAARENEDWEKRMEAERSEFNARMAEEDRQFREELDRKDAEQEAAMVAETKDWAERLYQEKKEHKERLAEERKQWTFRESEQLAVVQAEIEALKARRDEMDRDHDEKMMSIEERCQQLRKEKKEYDQDLDRADLDQEEVKRQMLFAKTMVEERAKHTKLLEREKKRLETKCEKTAHKKAELEHLNEQYERMNQIAGHDFAGKRHLKGPVAEIQSAYLEAKALNESLIGQATKEHEMHSVLSLSRIELQQTMSKMMEVVHSVKDKELRDDVMHLIMDVTKAAYKQMKVVQKLREEAIKQQQRRPSRR